MVPPMRVRGPFILLAGIAIGVIGVPLLPSGASEAVQDFQTSVDEIFEATVDEAASITENKSPLEQLIDDSREVVREFLGYLEDGDTIRALGLALPSLRTQIEGDVFVFSAGDISLEIVKLNTVQCSAGAQRCTIQVEANQRGGFGSGAYRDTFTLERRSGSLLIVEISR